MFTSRHQRAGFTLIELLVVIAIIMILAGITASVLPGILERAKLARLNGTFKEIQTSLSQYYTDHGTFPPAYGYLVKMRNPIFNPDNFNSSDPASHEFVLGQNYRPFMAFLGFHESFSHYDDFSDDGGDSDRDNSISRFEYSPVGAVIPGTNNYNFITNIFPNGVDVETNSVTGRISKRDTRPLIYVPINQRFQTKIARFWFANDGANPRPNRNGSDPNNTVLDGLSFPPPSYDAYVLIGVGPGGTTFGLVYSGNTAAFNLADYGTVLDDQPFADKDLSYHILAHAIYFMATRDADNNGLLDFDFQARDKQGEATNRNNNLPDPLRPFGFGPVIKTGP